MQTNEFKSNSCEVRCYLFGQDLIFRIVRDQMKKRSIAALQDRITYRAAGPEDEPFLMELYFSTRDDLAGLFTDQAQLRQMLRFQYDGQRTTYSQMYPEASHDIVLLDEKPVGRFLVDRRRDSILGVDLALVPAARGLGIGTLVLKRVMNECSDRRVPFVFHVLKTNPAKRLYERLGCCVAGEDPTHFYMEWKAKENE